MVSISKYLDADHVVFLDVQSRDEAITALVEVLDSAGKLVDKVAFLQAIIEREKIVSTGVGMGVAIPHAKLSSYHDFFIAVGVQRGRGLEWNAMDGAPVRLIFLVGGPDDKQTQYLQILSSITMAVKDEEKRKEIFKANNAEDLLQLLGEIEGV